MHIKLYPTLKKAFVAAAMLLVGGSAFAQTAAPYCQPTFRDAPCSTFNGRQTGIIEVKTTGATTNINNANNSCDASTGYARYTGTGNTLIANAGTTVVCSVKVNTAACTNNFGTRVAVWLDWKRSGASANTFENTTYNPVTKTGELFYQSRTADGCGTSSASSGQYYSGSLGGQLVIPSSAKEGWTRLRVRAGTNDNMTAGFPPGIPPTATDPCVHGGTGGHWAGEVEDYDVYIVNPCVMNPFNIEDVTDKGFNVKFRRRENAEMYEYFVSDTVYKNSTPPNGWSLTTDSLIKFPTANHAIECDKKYYIYIRTICDTLNLNQNDWVTSPWRLDSVTTPPCCYVPEVTITDVNSTSANVTWTPVPTVYKYEYIVSATDQVPTGSGTFTTSTGVTISGLAPSKEWYFFLRAYCNPTPKSDWGLDSFLTGYPLNVNTVNGVSDFGITAYPNPVKDVVKLQLNYGSAITGTAKVIVTDITGKLITTAEMEKDVLELNLSGKPAGTYIIKYADDAHTHVMHVYKQ